MKQAKLPSYATRYMTYLIDEWVHSERDRGILKRRMLDRIGFEQIAAEFELSRSQVIRIIEREEREVFKHFDPNHSMNQ